MGNIPGKQGKITDFKPLVYETQIFATWTISDVKELLKRFRSQVFGFAMVEAQFESIITFHNGVAKHVPLELLFEVLDNDSDGRIDGLEVLGGLALCCHATFEEKARFCFELFDFNLNASLSKKEMIMMMMSTVNGMNVLSGGGEESEFPLDVFEKLADDAFSKADRDQNNVINYEEFIQWARSNRDMMTGIERLTRLALEAKENMDSEDSAVETDEGDLSDAEPMVLQKKITRKREKGVQPSSVPSGGDEDVPLEDEPWRQQCHEPTTFKRSKKEKDGPGTNMELEWVFGLSSQKIRNSTKYIVGDLDPINPKFVVYPTAAIGVVCDLENRTQSFYQGHSEEITAIALHPSGRRIATADAVAQIHIWDAITLSTVCTIQGVVRQGYQLLEFSPTQDRLCTVGLDPDHTISFYDITSGEIVQSGKGISHPNNVNGIAFSRSGTEVALVGKEAIMFLKGVNTKSRALDAHHGKVGQRGKKQTFFCVAYCEEDAIVGCAGGELYRFHGGRCTEVIQAHGVKDPVLCIHYSAIDGCLVTGGKDGLVKTWDPGLKEIGQPLDLSEDLDGDGQADNGSLNTAVTSVQLMGNRVLVATKGSEVFEAIMPSKPTARLVLNRITTGHHAGELSGLAMHPFLDEFVTGGDDKTLRLWDLRRHEETCCKKLPEISRAVAYNNAGDIICVGMGDGGVALVTATSLKALSMWHHSDRAITEIKFSPDDNFVAVASEDGNIYLYKTDDKRKYRRQAVCRGHTDAVTHIDFSANGKYIQSNGAEGDNSILYWDMMGNLIKSHVSLRDTNWYTWTCTFGFPVQGIYPPGVSSSYVNCVHAVPEVGVILSGDDNNLVNLFRYPSLNPGALRQSHIGHAGNVSQVRFSYNRRHAVSLGSTDRAILVWAHELEFQESDDDMGVDSSASSSGSSIGSADSNLEGHPGLRPKIEKTAPVIKSTVVEPWRSCIVEPTNWLEELTKSNRYYLPTASTDVDFEVVRVHGCRLADTRGSVRYTAAGTIAYVASSSCIVYNRGTETQQIIHGSHVGPVVGLGDHPSGQVYATGEQIANPRIVLWSAVDARTITIIENAHPKAPGVSLLAFSESGKVLASVGMDEDNTLVTHEWSKRSSVFQSPTEKGRGKVLCLCFLANGSSISEDVLNSFPHGSKATGVGGPPTRKGVAAAGKDAVPSSFLVQSGNIVVTGGEKHLKFWWSQGQNVKCQRCIWGSERRQIITCVASASPMICVTGTKKGEILVWRNFKVEHRLGEGGKAPSPHQNHYIQTIWCKRAGNGLLNPLYITGDTGGNVVVWEMIVEGAEMKPDLKQLHCFNSNNSVSLKTTELDPVPLISAVQSVCARDGVLLVATQSSDIYEVPFGIMSSATGGSGRSCLATPTNHREMLSDAHYRDEFSDHLLVYPEKALHVVAGHMADVWGLAAHPKKSIYFTSGDDSTVRAWSLEPHKEIVRKRIPLRSRSLAVTIDGMYLAVGSTAGPIFIYHILYGEEHEVDFGEVHQEIRDSDQMIEVIKFSPTETVMAAASYDGCIYVRTTLKTDTGIDFSSGPVIVLRGHTGHITHFDFGIVLGPNEQYDALSNRIRRKENSTGMPVKKKSDAGRIPNTEDLVLQSNDSRKELRYWKVMEGKEIISAMEVRDVVWCTLTCPLGWPVQGIYDPDEEDSDEKGPAIVNAVCRNNCWQSLAVLAAADSKGRIRLFNYPCIVPGSPDKCYSAHSGNISDVVFTHDDSYCISIGRQDRCVVVWKTDIIEEIRERKALALDQEVQLTTDNLYLHNQKHLKMHGSSSRTGGLGPTVDEQFVEDEEFNEDRVEKDDNCPGGGDENMAVKPWKGAVREPSTWVDKPSMAEKPNENLELTFVYGYRGWDCRNNMSHAHNSKEIIYHVAGAGVVYNIENHSQVINTSNDDDITCLAVHPEGHTVATGEIGKKPKIVLWDSNTGVTLRELRFHTRGVNTVCFSPTGRLLVSTGMDVDRTIVVHNIESGIVVGTGKIGKGISVLTLSVSANGENMITAGKNHVKVWDMPKSDGGRVELSSKAGILNKNCRTVVSSAYLGVDAVTGMADGNIYLWKGRSISRVQKAHTAGTPVTSMTSLPVTGSSGEDSEPRILTGGKDGCVHIWNSQLVRQWSFDLKLARPELFHHQVQSVSAKSGMLVLGTKAGELVEVNMLSKETSLLAESHFSGELWGLDRHPSKGNFVTCGDDMTVRVWDSKSRQQIAMTSVPVKARAVAYSPDGFQLAVGLFDGTVKILQNDLTEIKTVKVAKAWVQCMRYSADFASLAVGSHDRNIYILETRNYSIRAVCRGHHSYVKQLDFNTDGSKLQSVSGDYELLFWDATNGSQIKSATSVRDESWATWTCTLGWPVQGIWPNGADGTDVNAVDRSPDGNLIASGDDFNTVKLFRYPCIKTESKFLSYKGHSSHVPSVRFSSDGRWLFSIGGLDKAVLQYQVKRSHNS